MFTRRADKCKRLISQAAEVFPLYGSGQKISGEWFADFCGELAGCLYSGDLSLEEISQVFKPLATLPNPRRVELGELLFSALDPKKLDTSLRSMRGLCSARTSSCTLVRKQ